MAEQFNNTSFKEFLQTLKGTMYAYSIEEDEDAIELTINSTTLSELDDTHLESGWLGGFSYLEKDEAFDDIQTATDIYGIVFEQV